MSDGIADLEGPLLTVEGSRDQHRRLAAQREAEAGGTGSRADGWMGEEVEGR